MQVRVPAGGTLAGWAAALHHGWDVLDATRDPDVVFPRDWGRVDVPGIRPRKADLPLRHRVAGVTSPVRTVIDCARWLPLREALVIADSALRAGVDVDADALARAAESARGPGAVRLRRAVRLADHRAESPLESCLRLIALAVADEVVPQARIPGVGRVDLLLDGWLVAEADGFAFHSSRATYREDRRRANALALAGHTLVRFSYEDIVRRPETVIATLRALQARQAA